MFCGVELRSVEEKKTVATFEMKTSSKLKGSVSKWALIAAIILLSVP